MKIIRVSQKTDFKELRRAWNQILVNGGSNNIFLTWEWLFNWWEVFADKDDELYILQGVEEGRIIAIAPLYLHKGYLKELKFLGSGIVCSEYLSFICSGKDAVQFARQVFAYLRRNIRQWDMLSLEGIPADDNAAGTLKASARRNNMRIKTIKKHRCIYMPLPDLKISRALKEKIESRKRKLGRKGLLEIAHSEKQEDQALMEQYTTLISLHQKRWKEMQCKEGGLFENRLFRQFMDRITAVFNGNNWLNINILTLDGKGIAAYYCFTFNGKVSGYLTGFDPAHKKCSPGAVCLWESLRYYEKKGFTEFDFLRGEEEYKRDWSENHRMLEDTVIAKKGMRAFFYLRAKEVCSFFKEIARRTISPRFFASIRAIKFRKSR